MQPKKGKKAVSILDMINQEDEVCASQIVKLPNSETCVNKARLKHNLSQKSKKIEKDKSKKNS